MKYAHFPNSKYAYYLLVGIVSFGARECGIDNFPGKLELK